MLTLSKSFWSIKPEWLAQSQHMKQCFLERIDAKFGLDSFRDIGPIILNIRGLAERLFCDGYVYFSDVHIVYHGSILQDATMVDYVNIREVHIAVAD